jgi:hypothetical protein
MGIFFISFSSTLGLMFLIFSLKDIKTELKYRNTLMEEQNDLLKEQNEILKQKN